MGSIEAVHIRNVTKTFGSTVAVNDVSLTIPAGSFTTLLGPSGCGKTTLLRILAGLEQADNGQILVGSSVIYDSEQAINVSARKRGIGLVFQSYALWPHMTVFQNVSYGLKLRKLSHDEIEQRTLAVLKTVGMEGYEKRYPSELSGGQQQRVSMARMLVVEPSVLLMDEPLSNLDAKLRLNLRAELKRVHEATGMTIVYVTHDQTEAMTLSTDVAVMNHGVVQQWAPPQEVYHNSRNLFVAEFMGTPTTNRITGTVQLKESRISLMGGVASFPLGAELQSLVTDGETVHLSIRPENIVLSAQEQPGSIPLAVYAYLDSGPDVHVYLQGPDGTTIIARDDNRVKPGSDKTLHVTLPADAVRLYRDESGDLIQ